MEGEKEFAKMEITGRNFILSFGGENWDRSDGVVYGRLISIEGRRR